MTTTQRSKTKEFLVALWPYLFLALLVAAAFWRAPWLGWVGYDDAQYVSENPLVTQGLGVEALKQAFTSTYASNWHPLTWLSHQLDVTLFGLKPGGHHVVNVLLHLAATLLLFAFFRAATKGRFPSPWPAFFVAAFFGVHPLRVESVAWLAERKDVLSAVFWVLCMLLYLHYARRPGFRRYLWLFLCMAAGLLAKPMLVTLPLALLLLDYWPLGRLRVAPEGCAPRDSWWRVLLEKLPLLALAAGSSWVTMLAQKGAMGSWEHLPLLLRFANSLQSYIFYIGQTFWPSGLAPYYPHPGNNISYLVSGICGGAIVAITIMVVLWRKRAPWLLMGWLWHLLTLAPVIGLVQVGGQSMADRYTYIPSIGLLAAVVYGVAALPWRASGGVVHKAAWALGLCALLPLVWATQDLTWYWRDGEALFVRALRVAPSDLAHNNLGNVYARQGKKDLALQQFLKAVELNPASYIASYNAGRLYYGKKNYAQAAKLLYKALEIKPDIYQAHQTLADMYLESKKPIQAAGHLRQALKWAPRRQRLELLNRLGVALAQSGNTGAARQAFLDALRMEPENAGVKTNLELLETLEKQGS